LYTSGESSGDTATRSDSFRQWITATTAFNFLNVLNLLPANQAIRFSDRFARMVEPLTPRHKLVLYNLALAYPEKSEGERKEIAKVGGR
jgi:KDO2-lipid IV(A) lauroyltransferase